MNRGEVSDSISIDLIIEILSRLPAKPIGRFRCVSKLWCDVLHGPYFTDLIMTKSRLYFAIGEKNRWSFYSSPQTQNPYQNTSRFYVEFDRDMRPQFCGLTSGLMYFSHVGKIKGEDTGLMVVICNPNTGQYAILPKLKRCESSESCIFLGFDPIDNQFKVLCMTYPYKILTLGTECMTWRDIQCPCTYIPFQGICINGVFYYLAYELSEGYLNWIVCFDVRSETFKFIETRCSCYDTLIDYKGKLGRIEWWDDHNCLAMWVLEDAEKGKWSRYDYTLRDEYNLLNCSCFYVAGMSATCEIVFAPKENDGSSFYVYYFNTERKTLQRVGIQGGEGPNFHGLLYAYVDHVEDLNVYGVKQLKSGPDVNIIRKTPKPPQRNVLLEDVTDNTTEVQV